MNSAAKETQSEITISVSEGFSKNLTVKFKMEILGTFEPYCITNSQIEIYKVGMEIPFCFITFYVHFLQAKSLFNLEYNFCV